MNNRKTLRLNHIIFFFFQWDGHSSLKVKYTLLFMKTPPYSLTPLGHESSIIWLLNELRICEMNLKKISGRRHLFQTNAATITSSLQTCASYSELPSHISTYTLGKLYAKFSGQLCFPAIILRKERRRNNIYYILGSRQYLFSSHIFIFTTI